jgi:hypothetical protein
MKPLQKDKLMIAKEAAINYEIKMELKLQKLKE